MLRGERVRGGLGTISINKGPEINQENLKGVFPYENIRQRNQFFDRGGYWYL